MPWKLGTISPTSLGVVLLVVFLFAPGDAQATPMLGIAVNPAPPAVLRLGDTLTVTITAEDIPAPGLFGFGFTLFFDSSTFTASVPMIDGSWTGLTDVDVSPGSAGATANLAGSGATMGPSGFGIQLATVVLTVVGPASDPSMITLLSLGHFTGPGDNLLFDGAVLDGASSPGFLSATATAMVPEPGTYGLGLLACLGLAFRASVVRD